MAKKIRFGLCVMSSLGSFQAYLNILVVFHMPRWSLEVSLHLAPSEYVCLHFDPWDSFVSSPVRMEWDARELVEDSLLCT